MGMTAARTWAHSIAEEFPFQTAPGQYDENGLKALDYVLHAASQHGIKLILSLIDNWKYYNGVDQYVDWCGPGRTWEKFKETHSGDTDTLVRGQTQHGSQAHRAAWRELEAVSSSGSHTPAWMKYSCLAAKQSSRHRQLPACRTTAYDKRVDLLARQMMG
jgi:hypothetical protein